VLIFAFTFFYVYIASSPSAAEMLRNRRLHPRHPPGMPTEKYFAGPERITVVGGRSSRRWPWCRAS